MPREIDCPEIIRTCENCDRYGECASSMNPDFECVNKSLWEPIEEPEELYTESEVQKLIKQEREEILNIFENYKDERDFYTWDEVQEAIRKRGEV